MTILEAVTTFIRNVKEVNMAESKPFKGCHTVFNSLADGNGGKLNLHQFLEQVFFSHLKAEMVTVQRKDKATGGMIEKKVSKSSVGAINAINALIQEGKILGHFAKGGRVVYLLGDANIVKTGDANALLVKMGMTPPPVIAPVTDAK